MFPTTKQLWLYIRMVYMVYIWLIYGLWMDNILIISQTTNQNQSDKCRLTSIEPGRPPRTWRRSDSPPLPGRSFRRFMETLHGTTMKSRSCPGFLVSRAIHTSSIYRWDFPGNKPSIFFGSPIYEN